ncbi:MAG: flavodoxin family protein [Anaerovoracaceae bacterium]|jgi:multimeric flavodoxin WrbA
MTNGMSNNPMPNSREAAAPERGARDDRLVVIKPHCFDAERTARLNDVLAAGLAGHDYVLLEEDEEIDRADLRRRRILFAISLGASGINLEFYALLKKIRTSPHLLDGSVGAILVDGSSEFFTKSVARELVFSANMAGCAFPGRPLVEGTRTLKNYNIIASLLGTDNLEAYRRSCRDLVERLLSFSEPVHRRPNLLALHAGSHATSNTLTLWHMVQRHLEADVTEISLRNGEVWDCRGCSYEACLHMGEQSRCFYGGVITHDVYPNILQCDGLVMICPNYNDAISANLTAFVNRLTAIFRVHRFFEKRLYAVIVSGYSGSDLIAEQLISGLNMNKTFLLPPRFAIMKTANDPHAVAAIPGIEEEAAAFGRRIMEDFRGRATPWLSEAPASSPQTER